MLREHAANRRLQLGSLNAQSIGQLLPPAARHRSAQYLLPPNTHTLSLPADAV